jgi:four helix bundle protein
MKIRTHKDLDVYKLSFECSVRIFELSQKFPKEETWSLTDQIRRSSRSVCANLAEAFRKRRYPKMFISKITDSEGEAAETQTWLDFALSGKYIGRVDHDELVQSYEKIIGKLVNMSLHPENWSW